MVESYQWQTELWRGNHAGWKFSYQLMPVWLVCVPSSSKKEPLSSACGLLLCFLAYKPSSLLPVAFINYHMLPSCGCQLILHAQSCAQVETHKPFLTSCKALQLIEGALWLVLFLDCIMNLSISVVFAVVLRIKQKVKFFYNQAGAAQCHIALIQTVWFWWHDVIHKAMAEKRMCLDRSQPITADVASLCCPHRRLKGHSSTTGPRREHSPVWSCDQVSTLQRKPNSGEKSPHKAQAACSDRPALEVSGSCYFISLMRGSWGLLIQTAAGRQEEGGDATQSRV